MESQEKLLSGDVDMTALCDALAQLGFDPISEHVRKRYSVDPDIDSYELALIPIIEIIKLMRKIRGRSKRERPLRKGRHSHTTSQKQGCSGLMPVVLPLSTSLYVSHQHPQNPLENDGVGFICARLCSELGPHRGNLPGTHDDEVLNKPKNNNKIKNKIKTDNLFCHHVSIRN